MPNGFRWVAPQVVSPQVGLLSAALGIRPVAARVLAQRGLLDPAAAQRFLHPKFEDLHDPFRLRDMDRAVERLKHAIAARERVLIYGDYDVDGTASVVILLKALELAGGVASYHV